MRDLCFCFLLIVGLIGCATKPELKWYEQIDASAVTSAYFFEFTNKDPHTEGNTFCAGFEAEKQSPDPFEKVEENEDASKKENDAVDPFRSDSCPKFCQVIKVKDKIDVSAAQVQSWVEGITDPKNAGHDFPFIGTLRDGIIFFNNRQKPVFALEIVLYDSLMTLYSVHVNQNGDIVARWDKSLWEEGIVKDKPFVTGIYNYLKEHYPERLERNEESFKRVNRDFRELWLNGKEVPVETE